MMKKAISIALCLLMAGTVLTACSNPDEFSDSENLSLKYTRSDKTDDTFNYADGADTAVHWFSDSLHNFNAFGVVPVSIQ